MLLVTIRVMMNLSDYAEDHGKTNVFIFVLIDLKKDIKEETVVVTKARTHL